MPDATALCEAHMGLAYHCARRFVGRGVPFDELAQQASAALSQAALRFDASRGLCFSTYAVPCILGELKRLCERLPLAHIPRADREALARVRRERAAFRAEHAREPTVRELGERLQVSAEELSALLTATSAAQPLDDASPPTAPAFDDYVLLRDAIDRLPPPLPTLLCLRFERGYTQARAAQALHITQPQLSRAERRAKELLRRSLTETQEQGEEIFSP